MSSCQAPQRRIVTAGCTIREPAVNTSALQPCRPPRLRPIPRQWCIRLGPSLDEPGQGGRQIPIVRRSARSLTPLQEEDLVLLPPPAVEQHSLGAMGLLQYLIPLVGSMGSVFFVIINPKPTYIGSSLLFMVGALGTGIAMASQQRQATRRRRENDRL